jgi:thiamine-monophosphate kinase
LTEAEFISALRGLPLHPGARSLRDDAAVLDVAGATLVLTHDVIAEGVHFLADDPPDGVAWKLVALNLSDLAAKGARPLGVLLGFPLGDEAWDRAFLDGLGLVLGAFGIPLLGGDTVKAPRVLGLTAIGRAEGPVPSRGGARVGDQLWVSGTIGDAGLGLRMLKEALPRDENLVERYRNPFPRLEAGQRLAPVVSAMIDISDGLLLDADRMATASSVAIDLDLSLIPLSDAARRSGGEDLRARLAAATAGDDYELLFAASPDRARHVLAIGEETGLPLTPIGAFAAGAGVTLTDGGEPLPLPPRLGWEHG